MERRTAIEALPGFSCPTSSYCPWRGPQIHEEPNGVPYPILEDAFIQDLSNVTLLGMASEYHLRRRS